MTPIVARTAFMATGLLTVLAASPASAQSSPAQAAAAPSRSEASAIEEVIVTARKREERSQDVPISLSSLAMREKPLRHH